MLITQIYSVNFIHLIGESSALFVGGTVTWSDFLHLATSSICLSVCSLLKMDLESFGFSKTKTDNGGPTAKNHAILEFMELEIINDEQLDKRKGSCWNA